MMQITRALATFLSLSTLTAAGPLRRDGANRKLQRRFENTTITAAPSQDGASPIPVHPLLTTTETEPSSTFATTIMVPNMPEPTTSLTTQTSLFTTPSTTSSSFVSVISTRSTSSSTTSFTTVTSAINPTLTSPSTILSDGITNSLLSTSINRGTLGSNASPQTSVSGPSSALSSTSSGIFPLIINVTVPATTLQTASVSLVSPVTDTYTATSSLSTSSVNIPVSKASTAATSTNTAFPLLKSSSSTSQFPSTSSISSSTTASVASAVSISNIPTVISTVPPMSTIDPATFSSNLAMAKGYNALFSSLTPSSSCAAGSIACINGSTGNCDGSGSYKLTTCAPGNSCFAVPMNGTAGVYVGCFDTDTADGILGIAKVNSVPTLATTTPSPSNSLVVSTTSKTTTKIATQAPQTFNSLSVTLPTASPGVIVPQTSQAPAPPSSLSSSSLAAPSPEITSTTTVQIHQTSTMIIYITPSSAAPAPVSSSPAPVVSQTTPVLGVASSSTINPVGLVTIIPMPSAGSEPVTVTVTATVTTTERIRE